MQVKYLNAGIGKIWANIHTFISNWLWTLEPAGLALGRKYQTKMFLWKEIFREVLSITWYNLKDKTIRRLSVVDCPNSTCYPREKGLHERFIQRNQHLLESRCPGQCPHMSQKGPEVSGASQKLRCNASWLRG